MFSKKDKSSKKTAAPGPQEVFQRRRWKHFLRWFAFLMVILMDAGFVNTSIQVHLVRHWAFMPKEILGYVLLALLNMFLLPSMVLEVDKVIVKPDKIFLHNLIWHFEEKWDELKSFKEPPFFKFAMLAGKKFLYLINKKDIQGYETLVETIEHKAPQATLAKTK
jgi:hypothetical protein